MLHVVNGDSTLGLLKQAEMEGDFLVWKDMLMEGPVGETSSGELDWNARAAYLKDRFGINPKTYLADMKNFFSTLNRAANSKTEVTFWFEEDFFCQIHLVYLLANLPAPLLKRGRAFVICPDKLLGIHMPSAMDRLFNTRLPLEQDLVTLSRRVWKAYSLSSTAGWQALLTWMQAGKGFAVWPMLQRGLRCHLGRRPAPHGGLNPIEAAMLKALISGPMNFQQFFRLTWKEPHVRPLGLGDMQLARYALDFAAQGLPLIKIEGKGSTPKPGQHIITKDWKIGLTAEGKSFFPPPQPTSLNRRKTDKAEAKAKPKAGKSKPVKKKSKK